MIRLLREVDYNKYDKTFYFNDAANVARNVFARRGVYNIIYLRNTTLDDLVDNIDEYFRNNIYDNILIKEEIDRAAATNQNKVR